MSDELKIALEASKKGIEEALKYFDTKLHIEKKSDGSVVTEADRNVEKIIKRYISEKIPNAVFIAEEENKKRTSDTFWVIDPIDGSRAFAHGTPFWCVLIALYKNGKPVLGVCNFPLLGGALYAEKNKGAYLEGKKVHVSSISNLSDSLFSFGSFKRFKDKSYVLKLVDITGGTRSPEPTYSVYLIAQGKVDICVDEYAEIWDRAPFLTIIPEAGGKITNKKGEFPSITDRGYFVTNGLLHDDVLKTVNS